MGKKRPQRNIIGNLKKFENVCASKTSFVETAINSPRNVETIAIRIIAGITIIQDIVERSVKKRAKTIGTTAFTDPKKMAPEVLANIRSFKEIGARSNLANELFFFSNVIVTANIEVVPNKTERAITPGKSEGMLSSPRPDLIKNIPVQAIGKIRPQLIFGGLR